MGIYELDPDKLLEQFKREGYKHPAVLVRQVFCDTNHMIGVRCNKCGFGDDRTLDKKE